jgi:hypothetical protein
VIRVRREERIGAGMSKGYYIRRDDGKWLCGHYFKDQPDFPYCDLAAAMNVIECYRLKMAVFNPAHKDDQFSVFHFDPREKG